MRKSLAELLIAEGRLPILLRIAEAGL